MINKSGFYIVYAVLIIAALFVHLHSDIKVPLSKPFEDFPIENKEWHMVAESKFTEDILEVLRPTDYLSRQYAGPDDVLVALYIGYHDGSKDSGPIHSPKNCLPGGGWFLLSEEKSTVQSGLKEIELMKVVYQKGDHKKLFLYWYNVKGETISNEYALKLAEIKNSMLYRRRDSAFIRVSVDIESDVEMSLLVGETFIKDFYPVIAQFLPE